MMKSLILINLFLICKAVLERRIINGDKTSPKPWVAFLNHPSYSCGGTLYTESCVITAAHCNKFMKEGWRAYPGIEDIGPILSGRGGPGLVVLERVKYPHYVKAGYKFDLSLWWIDGPSSKRTIVDLDDGNQVWDQSSKLFAVGWGLTKYYPNDEMHMIPLENTQSDHLMKIEVKVLNTDMCCAVFERDILYYPVFCIGATKTGQGLGFGDSGGPIYMRKKKRVVLVGVISKDRDRNDQVFFGLNSLVSNVFYKEFINYYADLFKPENKGSKLIALKLEEFKDRTPSPDTIRRISYLENGNFETTCSRA